MPRTLAPIPPELTGPLPDLAQLLREIWHGAGQPNLRALAKSGLCSASTLSNAMSGRRVPTWTTCQALLRGCGRASDPYLTQVRTALDDAVQFKSDQRRLAAARIMPIPVNPLRKAARPNPRRVQTPQDLQRALVEAHIAVGRPSRRKLQAMAAAAGQKLPASTVGDLLKRNNPHLPKWTSVGIFLTVCEVPNDEFEDWRHAYIRVHRAVTAQRRLPPPVTPVPAAATYPAAVVNPRSGLPQRRRTGQRSRGGPGSPDPATPWTLSDAMPPPVAALPRYLPQEPAPTREWLEPSGGWQLRPAEAERTRYIGRCAVSVAMLAAPSGGLRRSDIQPAAGADPSTPRIPAARPAPVMPPHPGGRRRAGVDGHRYPWPNRPGSPAYRERPRLSAREALPSRLGRIFGIPSGRAPFTLAADDAFRLPVPARTRQPDLPAYAVVTGRRRGPRHRRHEPRTTPALRRPAPASPDADRQIVWTDGEDWAGQPHQAITGWPALKLLVFVMVLLGALWLASTVVLAWPGTASATVPTPQVLTAATAMTVPDLTPVDAATSAPAAFTWRTPTGVGTVARALTHPSNATLIGAVTLVVMVLLFAGLLLADRYADRNDRADLRAWKRAQAATVPRRPARGAVPPKPVAARRQPP
ncbi:hypothetical protein Cme02nite_63730 [Catellatospora methionotrophica]|uniref:Uncharacterized protein n=1 Tax=Catellatospora methionotrophica TaxID=121620 RepID=A0A8J3PK33_9ACTN|nr:hypothetical protein [Catellatospora methionotrophica]GIG18041.1 hypothetical protein Cme02nite_63730 [Catellatospora methionotrophica]